MKSPTRKDIYYIFITLIALAALWLLASPALGAIPQKEPRPVSEPTVFSHENCQYPLRSTNPPNGCDNSDPACPELTKGATTCPSDVPVSTPPETIPATGGK